MVVSTAPMLWKDSLCDAAGQISLRRCTITLLQFRALDHDTDDIEGAISSAAWKFKKKRERKHYDDLYYGDYR